VIAGCESQKSSNPLSPTVAGPIPGVEISAPKLLEPAQGWKLKPNQQPITLLVENAWTTGVRPLKYKFDVSVDAGFQTIVFSKSDIAPGEGGRTSLRLTDKLELGRTYYWRANAYDGANTGPIPGAVSFDIYPPSVLNPPVLLAPGGGEILTTRRPPFTLQNSGRSGPIGNVSYQIQVSKDSAFSQVVTDVRQPENGGGQTIWSPSGDFEASKTHYWRAFATDGETTSAWSATQSFKTAGAPAPAPTPIPPGGSCSSLAANPVDVVTCRRSQYGSRISPGEAPGLLRSIASDLNAGTGASNYGLLVKTSGNNCSGFACDIICYRDGHIWDVFGDGPDASAGYAGVASPQWGDKGFVSASGCNIQ
jgi:hypothetical protein